MNVTVLPGRARGDAVAPPSKSCAHRQLICAALAGAGATVENISLSEDVAATLNCISALGGQFEIENGKVFFSRGLDGNTEKPILHCSESGSTLRFFIPLVLALCGGGVFTGTHRLMQRGVSVYEDIFSEIGVSFTKEDDMLTVNGKLTPGKYTLPGDVSSQYISGLMLALPLLKQSSIIEVIPPIESRGYIDLTLNVLKKYGIEIIKQEQNRYYIPGDRHYGVCCTSVEGDWSNSAFFHALNSLGGSINISGLDNESVQGDRVCTELFDRLKSGCPDIDVSDCPDLAPVLFAVAAAHGGGTFTGTHRLRLKESDRANVMAEELKKFSVDCIVEENRVIIRGGKLSTPGEILQSHNDHRIAMALTVLCTVTGGTVAGAECVAKSYPEFFDVMRKLNIRMM